MAKKGELKGGMKQNICINNNQIELTVFPESKNIACTILIFKIKGSASQYCFDSSSLSSLTCDGRNRQTKLNARQTRQQYVRGRANVTNHIPFLFKLFPFYCLCLVFCLFKLLPFLVYWLCT